MNKDLFIYIIQITGSMFLFIFILLLFTVGIQESGYVVLTFTTVHTIIWTALAYSFGLKNKYINTMACVSFVLFFCIDFTIHLIIGIFQLGIILSKSLISKKMIIVALFYWAFFMFLIDDVYRVAWYIIIPIIDKELFTFTVLYLLGLSGLIVYLVKSRRNCLINDCI